MKPSQVTKAKEAEVWDTLYGSDVQKKVRFKFQVGDRVRISKVKRIFEKSYLPNFRVKTFPESNPSPIQNAESLVSGISSLENFPEGSTSFFLSFGLRSTAACRGLEGEQNVLFICLHLHVFCNIVPIRLC